MSWSDFQDTRLKAMWPDHSIPVKVIAHRLAKSQRNVRLRATTLGLQRGHRGGVADASESPDSQSDGASLDRP